MKRFVVREGVGCRPSFSFEHCPFDISREKPTSKGGSPAYIGKIIYQAEVADDMPLADAIWYYGIGGRWPVPEPPPSEKLPPLAELLAQKREKRARAAAELTGKAT